MYLSKTMSVVVSMLVLGAIAWPMAENWKPKPKDNFPLSYFPMFSAKRDSVHSLSYAVGYDANNQRCYIPYSYLGSGGFNQVRRQVNKKARQGKCDKLAEKAANRLEKCKNAPFCNLQRVEIVTGYYDLDQYFNGGSKLPLRETILTTQAIAR